MMRRLEATLHTKLFYQVLLLVGCLALALGVLETLLGRIIWLTPQGWWEGAIAAWVLVIAVRMVYPPVPR
jgi:hypothetical protein